MCISILRAKQLPIVKILDPGANLNFGLMAGQHSGSIRLFASSRPRVIDSLFAIALFTAADKSMRFAIVELLEGSLAAIRSFAGRVPSVLHDLRSATCRDFLNGSPRLRTGIVAATERAIGSTQFTIN